MAFKRPVRSRPIRVFLISMFAVPLVSLLALWGFVASITVSNAISDHEYNVSAAALTSGVRGLIIALPQERVQSYFWLNSGGTTPKTSMLAARQHTGPGDPGGPDRPERPAGTALRSNQVGAEDRAHRAGTARDDPGGHRFRRDEPDGRVRRLQHHHRPPLRLLRYVGPGPGGLAGGDLGRRRGLGLRVRDDHPGDRAGGWCAARPRPDERDRPDPVRQQRGEPAPAHERVPCPDAAPPERRVHQPRELAGLPAVPGHGKPDPGQHGPHPAGECRRLAVGLAGGSGRHGEDPARHR